MELEKENNYRDYQYIHNKCKKCLFYHTALTFTDGRTIDGIIESVDPDRIIVLVGENVMDSNDDNQYDQQRQYGWYHRPGIRYRRFRRQAFPLATLAALSLLPYPYIAPMPYPYFPY
ncbi:hypothetical protein [Clostridium sp.]|uniref:hypothetical protein n=1 Tax=Clostridium sp. TaxID=1506 RepID=UPI00261C73C8|nr:hypothetical protein [Clostridium sp.]